MLQLTSPIIRIKAAVPSLLFCVEHKQDNVVTVYKKFLLVLSVLILLVQCIRPTGQYWWFSILLAVMKCSCV